MSEKLKSKEQCISDILLKDLQFESTEVRNSDRLDFKEVFVATVKQALEKAYEKGASDADPYGFYNVRKNPALWVKDHGSLNPCTKYIAENHCDQNPCLVELFDGSFEKVWYAKEVEQYSDGSFETYEYFVSKTGKRWHLNGISYTTYNWDIVNLG